MNACIAFLTEDTAATAVEYAVMLAMIIMTMIGAISAFGGDTGGLWGNVQNEMEAHGMN